MNGVREVVSLPVPALVCGSGAGAGARKRRRTPGRVARFVVSERGANGAPRF